MAAQDGVIPIRVLVRVRPLSKKENNENAQECVRTYVEQNQVYIFLSFLEMAWYLG